MRRTLLIAAVASLLASCGGEDKDPWTYGDVAQRDFDPAHVVHHPSSWRDGGQDCRTEYAYDWMSGDFKPKNVCSDRPDIFVPAWDEYVPDRWRVQVSEDSDGSDETPELHWITVSEPVYDDCLVGRRYVRELKECPPR